MNEVRNIIVGFDLGERASQICYYDRKKGEPVSLSMKVGSGQYTFPNCLSKKHGEEIWHFGLEVEYFVSRQEETYLDQLYQMCLSRRTILVEDRERSVGELLGIFIGNALRILGVPDPVRSISGLMITTPKLSKCMVENIQEACQYVGFARNRCFIQDYKESFYYHTLYQKQDIWSRKVALFTFDKNQVSYSWLELDRKTKPIQASVKKGKEITLQEEAEKRDREFYQLVQESLGTDIYSSIFLVGDGFDKEWAVRSIPLLCRNQRHVFYGNNLFAKGACCAAKEKVEERNLKGYLYSGGDLVRKNIGMEMLVFGSPAYYSLISAGVNWYEAMGECEILLDDVQELTFVVSSMESAAKERYSMKLPGLPERPAKATRLRLRLEFASVSRCEITVEDLGFGELYPSSGQVWHETIEMEGGAE